MRTGIISVYVDSDRRGRPHRGILQPQIGPLIAALLPPDAEVEVINDAWGEPDWNKSYDLLFISCLHSDFDRARMISHYWRRRGAKTVFGGPLASLYPDLCRAFFDSVVVGDPESTVPAIVRDFSRRNLQPFYVSSPYDPQAVPVPRFDLIADQQPVPLLLEATRGCPFTCEFCALTGVGTRHHVRPVEAVLRDIREGQRMLRDRTPWHMRRFVGFVDNNIGGNLRYLESLCEAIAPLKILWGSAITFNAVADPEVVKAMSRSGCRFVFVGLESFNPAAISDMNKHQNAIDGIRTVIDGCRSQGITLQSGMMLSPNVDDWNYISSISRHLRDCGLHLPTFLCFESPFPGTPYFHRLASEETSSFLPNALLRDFSGYTMVVRPKREPLERFIQAYRWLLDDVYSSRARAGLLMDNVAGFLPHGWFIPILGALADYSKHLRPGPDRTFIAGTDTPPPEAAGVPFLPEDFDSEEERELVTGPWRVTDAQGNVLPCWRQSVKVFEPRGRVSAAALQLTSKN